MPRAPLLPKLRGQFAEFLRHHYLASLGMLYQPTSVSLGTVDSLVRSTRLAPHSAGGGCEGGVFSRPRIRPCPTRQVARPSPGSRPAHVMERVYPLFTVHTAPRPFRGRAAEVRLFGTRPSQCSPAYCQNSRSVCLSRPPRCLRQPGSSRPSGASHTRKAS